MTEEYEHAYINKLAGIWEEEWILGWGILYLQQSIVVLELGAKMAPVHFTTGYLGYGLG